MVIGGNHPWQKTNTRPVLKLAIAKYENMLEYPDLFEDKKLEFLETL